MLLERAGVIADAWSEVGEDTAIPWHGPVIVPLARLDEALGVRPSAGVAIPNDADLAALRPLLPRLGLIAVAFPGFADGRGFSVAQRLRAMGYEARLRATGHLIADQFAYLLACGFDEVKVPDEIAARQPAAQWLAQLSKITLGYQRGPGVRTSIPDSRGA